RRRRPEKRRRYLSHQCAQRRRQNDPLAEPGGGPRGGRFAGVDRYNNLRPVTVQGSPAAGGSSGQALKAKEDGGARPLPAGFAGEWTDTAFQEKRAEGKTGMILAFAVLFAYLFLVGLYESWTIPVPVLLSVSVGILGSFAAIVIGRLTLDLYGQIGMI